MCYKAMKSKMLWSVALFFGLGHLTLSTEAAYRDSLTVNELSHIASGVAYLKRGITSLYPVNPPISKAILALPFTLWLGNEEMNIEERMDQFQLGLTAEEAIRKSGCDINMFHILLRVPSAAVSLLGAYLIWKWAFKLYGAERAACFATVLWLSSPSIINSSHLATPDIFAAAAIVLMGYTAQCAVHSKSIAGFILLGTICGFSTTIKFSLIAPALAVFIITIYLLRVSIAPLKLCLASLVATLAGILILNIVYYAPSIVFGDRTSSLIQVNQNSETALCKNDLSKTATCRRLALNFTLFPADFSAGISQQVTYLNDKRDSFMLGRWNRGGFRLFYVIGCLCKSPESTILLFLMVLFVTKKRFRSGMIIPGIMCAAILMSAILISSNNTRHIRYVLPAAPCVFVIIGSLAVSCKTAKVTILILAALTYNVTLVLLVRPGFLSYYNYPSGIIAGGPPLIDSGFDWGQDLARLSSWIKTKHYSEPIFLAAYGSIDPGLYGIKYRLPTGVPLGMPEDLTKKYIKKHLSPGCYIVSFSLLRGLDCPVRDNNVIKMSPKGHYVYLGRFKRECLVRTTLSVFFITKEDLSSL